MVIIWVIAFRQETEKPKFTGQGKDELQNTEQVLGTSTPAGTVLVFKGLFLS